MTKEEVITKIGENNWPKFLKFIDGQTIGVNKDNSLCYYPTDVNRFRRMMIITKQK